MGPFLKRAIVFLFLVSCASSWGQSLPLSVGKAAPATATNSAPDPLERDTPYGTLFGFLEAAQAGNYSTAAQFLQMPAAKRLTEGPDLANKLNVVVNNAFTGSLKKLSKEPNGVPQEGVPPDQQNIGVLSAGETQTTLVLVHVAGPDRPHLADFE